jgi:hypothetical protein
MNQEQPKSHNDQTCQAEPEQSAPVIAERDKQNNEQGAPHFHAVYGEYKITVEIESGKVRGNFPGRALRLVLEWAELHEQELLDDWERARQRQPLTRIAPLE